MRRSLGARTRRKYFSSIFIHSERRGSPWGFLCYISTLYMVSVQSFVGQTDVLEKLRESGRRLRAMCRQHASDEVAACATPHIYTRVCVFGKHAEMMLRDFFCCMLDATIFWVTPRGSQHELSAHHRSYMLAKPNTRLSK
jgi:hypothetical protein